MSRRHPSRFSANRGSVLIVALILAAAIALFLGSYLSLNLQTTRLAKRSFYGYAALNLSEAGAERAVWSFNRAAAGESDAWDGWSRASGAATRRLSDFNLAQNTRSSVQVYVDNYNPGPNDRVKLVSLATVTPANDGDLTRMIEVTIRKRSLFANGLVAREGVVFNGSNASVDSWNSDPDADAATAPLPYDPAIRHDKGSVASISVAASSVLVNQANVWGYVYTGGAQPAVGNNGTIRGAGTPADVKVDPSRIATDFTANLDVVAAPVDGTLLSSVGATLGTLGQKTKWRVTSISLSGSDTLTILGDVTLVLTNNAAGKALELTGNSSIIIPNGSSLTVYAEAEIKVAGKGVANANAQPVSFSIWGTRASGSQDIAITGNGALKAVVYAPNGKITINGNGDVMGAVVGQTITLSGNATFHYDESLAEHGESSYGISEWRELTTPTERARYSSAFAGW